MSSPDAMKNGQIFSQQDVVAYLERKGLSDDTIKRLQIYNPNDDDNKPNHVQSAKKYRIKKSKRSSSNSRQQQQRRSTDRDIKYVSHSSNKYVVNSHHHQHNKQIINNCNRLPPVHHQKHSHIQHSPRYYQEQYKKQQKAKRMKMIKNYSDAELLKILNKKRSRRSVSPKKRRHKKNKRRTLSVGVGRRLRSKTKNKQRNDEQHRHHQKQKKNSQTQKLKQLQKYYHLKLKQNQQQNLMSSTLQQSAQKKKERKKKKMMRQSKSHRVIRHTPHSSLGREHQDAAAMNPMIDMSDSAKLLNAMEQILGKEKKNAIEQYYKNLYSQQQPVANVTDMMLPIILPKIQTQTQTQSISAEVIDHIDIENEIDNFRAAEPQQKMTSETRPKSLRKRKNEYVPAMEPDYFGNDNLGNHEFEFEIENYLKPNSNSMGDDTMIHLLLFTNKHNIDIDAMANNNKHHYNLELELNLPTTKKMDNFEDVSHAKYIEQLSTHPPCKYYIETIDVDPNDWSKILEDRRQAPQTTHGSTASLPLFIPREQRSMQLQAQPAAPFNARSRTGSIQKDVLQRLSAPNLHTINGRVHAQYEMIRRPIQPLPVSSNTTTDDHQQEEEEEEKKEDVEIVMENENSLVKKVTLTGLTNAEFIGLNDEYKGDDPSRSRRNSFHSVIKMKKMAVQIRKKAIDGMISDTIENMDAIRNEKIKANGGKDISDDEFISHVTDMIVEQISKGMDVSKLIKDAPFLKKLKRHSIRTQQKNIESALASVAANTTPKEQEEEEKASVQNVKNIADIHQAANKQLECEQLIGNEPLTQGARANQTSIGSALLSIKMSGLKQRLTPSSTATASINPYDTTQTHSKLIETDKFGHNKSTPARPPAQQQIVPDVIQGNTDNYQFKSVQAQQVQMQQQMMAAQVQAQQQMMQQQGMMPVPHPMMVQSPYISPYGGFQPHFNFSPYGMQNGGGQLHPQQFMQQQQNINTKNGNISDDTMSISSKRSRKSKKSMSSMKRGKKSNRSSGTERTEEKVNQAVIKDLFTKSINNRYNEVEELLASNLDPNTRDEHGNGILHVAAQNGNKRLMKVALRWGADINGQNKQGQTALHYLFAYKYENLAAYLISKGSDDTIQNEFGYTCYDGLRPVADA